MTDMLTGSPCLRVQDGRVFTLDMERWVGQADPVDEDLLDRAEGPVLDVGCGPGRHVQALRRRGIDALGLDISPTAVALARRRGAPVLQRSVFEELGERGPWRTALLLDGSVGIGGDPEALLRRIGQLLGRRGRLLVEAEPSHVPTESMMVRSESPPRIGPWFPWARVSAGDVADLADRAGFSVAESWSEGGRYFSAVESRQRVRRPSRIARLAVPGGR